MTTLVVEQLDTTITQEFTVKEGFRLNVGGVRPYLFATNDPAGTFTVSLLDSSDNVLASGSFTVSDVKTALETTDTHWHALYSVAFGTNIPLNPGTYKLQLSSTGYTFISSSYLGWVARHEDIVNELDFTPVDDSMNPLTFEIWEYDYA